jgi:hypothetical protein
MQDASDLLALHLALFQQAALHFHLGGVLAVAGFDLALFSHIQRGVDDMTLFS